jgi:hypothetical protein
MRKFLINSETNGHWITSTAGKVGTLGTMR